MPFISSRNPLFSLFTTDFPPHAFSSLKHYLRTFVLHFHRYISSLTFVPLFFPRILYCFPSHCLCPSHILLSPPALAAPFVFRDPQCSFFAVCAFFMHPSNQINSPFTLYSLTLMHPMFSLSTNCIFIFFVTLHFPPSLFFLCLLLTPIIRFLPSHFIFPSCIFISP